MPYEIGDKVDTPHAEVAENSTFVVCRLDQDIPEDALDEARETAETFVESCKNEPYCQYLRTQGSTPFKGELLRNVKEWASARITAPLDWTIQIEEGPRAVVTIYHMGASK